VKAGAPSPEGARQPLGGVLEPLCQCRRHPHPADAGERGQDDEERAEREHVEMHGVAELVRQPRRSLDPVVLDDMTEPHAAEREQDRSTRGEP
jgi:hypothetical protein